MGRGPGRTAALLTLPANVMHIAAGNATAPSFAQKGRLYRTWFPVSGAFGERANAKGGFILCSPAHNYH
jgi:hypothetical protein